VMGKIAASLADICIITDDNPRFEEPGHIRSEILNSCPGAIEIANRRDAIAYAISNSEPGDIVLIAGKGHEEGQIIGNTTFPFNDREEILKGL
ncbi:MAG: UDP-N-acetylmuramoyl-L-alanyl-D-glutamate--2,6-diaminopimelate ligase, partial [Alphaproteobacteria bacterium]|nr:UDP-N-acetylmuramoyl-L-alanyl-D-glutamate--2,6-diaminopimelate ligase [Alphaproteobacteria bacterium]